MTFPFTALVEGARQDGLVIATLIGIAFGFVLERAGFGRADKLAAQFYLRDLRVFKVMFTAIVTAMSGLVIASGIGLTNLRAISESIASLTWIWPMLIGGFVLGTGFIISGYCPGTSIVAAGSGNVDGMFTVAGVISGTLIYTQLLRIPAFAHFHNSGEKGAWFLYDIVKVPPAVIAAGITAFAIAMFVLIDLSPGQRSSATNRRYAFAALISLAIGAIVTITIATPASGGRRPAAVSPGDLAHAIVDEPWHVRVLDVRDAAAFAKDRIPGSQNVTAEALNDLTNDGRAIVIVGEAKSLPPNAHVLAGGIAAWNADPFVKAMTSGAPPPPPPVAAGGVIAKPKKKGGGCSS